MIGLRATWQHVYTFLLFFYFNRCDVAEAEISSSMLAAIGFDVFSQLLHLLKRMQGPKYMGMAQKTGPIDPQNSVFSFRTL